MTKPVILVIDDEAAIRKLLDITLSGYQYVVRLAENASEGLRMAASHPPDLVILDLGLPDKSGQSVLKDLREWYNNGIIILSAQSSEEEIIEALDSGANDYLVKPFRTGELLARIRATIRQQSSQENKVVLKFGELELDLFSRTVMFAGESLKLTSTEYTLLTLFVKNAGRVLTHGFLLSKVWGPSYSTEAQYLRVYVAQLRKKIEPDPNHHQYFITEPGIGYRFIGKP